MLTGFLNDLFNGRPVRVGPPTEPDKLEVKQALRMLEAFEKDYRLELPGPPPPLDFPAAEWSAVSLYLASSLAIHRDAGADDIERLLTAPSFDQARPESHYAVDLTMRYLPGLLKLAKSAASGDPLVSRLMGWARGWPLSSVGVSGVGAVDAAPLRTSQTLTRLYIDRIIAAEDVGRLDDAVIRDAATAVLGDHPELTPAIARALKESG